SLCVLPATPATYSLSLHDALPICLDGLGAIADLVRTRRGGDDGGADRGRVLAAGIVVGDDHHVSVLRGDLTHQRPLAGVAIATGDRKSTRLNSSHVKISYAVFCLK